MGKVTLERTAPTWVLTINRPEVRNCIDGETASLIEQGIGAFSSDADARVLVVTGAGEAAFSSGADLKVAATEILGREGKDRSGPLGFARLDPGKPTIAAVNGYCFAGGLELAVWCDFRIAAENAEFGVLNRRWGISLIDGGTQRLPRVAGLGDALYLILTGARIGAVRALSMGLVQEVVPVGGALARARELAEHIASYPQASVRADRAAALAAFGLGLPEGLDLETELTEPSLSEPDIARALAGFASGARPEPPRG